MNEIYKNLWFDSWVVYDVSVPQCPEVTSVQSDAFLGGILNDVTNLDQAVLEWPIASRLKVWRWSHIFIPRKAWRS